MARTPAPAPAAPAAPAGTAVLGVPVEEVRSGIQRRLDAGRPTGLSDDHWRHTRTLYRLNTRGSLWLDDNGLRKDRVTALAKALVDASNDALKIDGYPLADLQRALAAVRGAQHPTAEQLADADVLLTASYAALGEDLLVGQIDPRTLSQDWHINPMEERVDSALVRGLRSDALDQSIVVMRPQDPDYAALRQELARYRELAAKGDWPQVPAGRALKPGEVDAAARLDGLRARLSAEGFTVDSAPAATTAAAPADSARTTGRTTARTTARSRNARTSAGRALAPGQERYDRALAGAVADFQARHGIVVDSILGAETVQSMNVPVSYRLGQIAANLERYRWLPRTLGARYIIVNVPAFHLEAWDDGKKALEMKVIVGAEYENRKTPVFSDMMQYVVFRPYWNVTDSIAKKEIWPKAEQDPDYLAKNDYETYQENGKTRVRQRPGPKNSLGLVKFLFPNQFDVYLHDTPQGELFQKDIRAFSHGCIRLEKPAELAQWVLGWPADRVQQAMQNGPDNRTVTLPQKLPVYITYFTTYVRDGQLYFGNDLYKRDDALVAAVADAVTPSAQAIQMVDAMRRMVGG